MESGEKKLRVLGGWGEEAPKLTTCLVPRELEMDNRLPTPHKAKQEPSKFHPLRETTPPLKFHTH